ncbi:MAG: YdcF family protein [Verrucomicrobiota bacterium]
MFFVLSKVLIFILKPFLWVVFCFLGAALARSEKWRRRFFVTGLVLLLVFSNPFLLRRAYLWWEHPATEIAAIEEPYDVAIVLGGFSDPMKEPRDRLHVGGDGGRLLNALELYREGKVKRLVIAGGSAAVLGEKVGEAVPAGRFLRRMGIPEEDVMMDNGSRNTRENALASAKLLEEMGGEEGAAGVLLVTSGFHMRRALGCFEKAGVEAAPFATDHRADREGSWIPGEWLIPSAGVMMEWSRLLKEWVGTVVYRVRGWA